MQTQYTTKAAEVLQAAQKLAADSGHPELTAAHLAVALLRESEGVPAAVLKKLGVDPRVLAGELVLQLDKLPKASGSSLQAGRSFAEALYEAGAAAKRSTGASAIAWSAPISTSQARVARSFDMQAP